MNPLYGAIEGGGTKFICAVGCGPDDLSEVTRIPTTTPEETLGSTIAYFKQFPGLKALGVACFGPLDPDKTSPTYGRILATPKAGWANTDIVGALQAALNLPVGFDTDVNGAALAEARWGAGQGCDPVLYLTIGTGIGGGAVVNGKLLHGLIHPEMGHIRLPRDPKVDPFPGSCPFHGDCFEGLANGPAMEKRWGQKAETLPPDHPAWDLEAHYIAIALADYIFTLSPQKIIIGGGVAQQAHMLPLIHQKIQAVINGYVQSNRITRDIQDYVVQPGLGTRSGVLGALALAEIAAA